MRSVALKVKPPNPPRFVPGSIFLDARWKVYRAKWHLSIVSNLWESNFNTHRCIAMGQTPKPKDGKPWSIFDIRIDVHVILGISDCIRNLRSSLDYLPSALARLKLGSDDSVVFPFHKTRKKIEDNFNEAVGSRLKPIKALSEHYPKLKSLILDEVQPWSKDDGAKDTGDLLWRVITADNHDKHRLIQPTTQSSGIKTAFFRGGGGMFNSAIIGNMPFPQMEFDEEPDIDFDLIFKDVERLDGRPVMATLNEACDVASKTVELFELHLFGK